MLEPRRRTPRILICHCNQPVFHRVLVDIIQPRQIAVLVGQFCVAEIEPHFPAFDAVQLVQIVRGNAMQIMDKRAEIPGFRVSSGRRCDSDWRTRPRLRAASHMSLAESEQTDVRVTMRLSGVFKVMLSVQRAGGDEIHGVVGQTMHRGMRPVLGRQLGLQIHQTHGNQLEGVGWNRFRSHGADGNPESRPGKCWR